MRLPKHGPMVLQLRNEGKTYKEIGQLIGISGGRAQQIGQFMKRLPEIERKFGWTKGLSTRVVNSLANVGIHSRASAKALFNPGDRRILHMRNFGRKGIAELKQWLAQE